MNAQILSSLTLAVCLTVTIPYTNPAQAAPAPAPETAKDREIPNAAVLGALPLSFEENVGQAPSDVLYFAHGRRQTVALGSGTASFTSEDGVAVRMRFGRARSIRAEGQLPGVVNYLVGKDASEWHTDVATFERVHYDGVAPGIDLVFYGRADRPEYDFVVAPGADPALAVATFEGATAIRVDASGDLVLETPAGEARQPKPVIYQETPSGRHVISGGFNVSGNRVGFSVGEYDRALPLVIDPALQYATYYGGTSDDRVDGAAVTPSGELVFVGLTNSASLPLAGSFLQGNQSGQDGFVVKLNTSGTSILYATYLGGSGTDALHAVAIDSSGRIFVTGASSSSNYPTVNAYDNGPLSSNSSLDAVLTVLTSSGSSVVYSTFIGGGNNDIGNAVAVDNHGNAYIAGEALDFTGIFHGRNFPTKSPSSLPPFQRRYGGGGSDAFVCKFDVGQSGNSSLTYSTLIGGDDGEGVEAIVVDDLERAYVCGYTESTDFPRLNALQNAYGGGDEDGFIAKFNADGTALFYSTFFGGSAAEQLLGIALDTSNGQRLPVITGFTTSSNIQTQLPIQAALNGPEDMIALKLNDTGTALVFSTYLGGGSNDDGRAVATDAAGNAYITGNSVSSYPLLDPIPINGLIVTHGAYVTKLSPSGGHLQSTCVGPATGEAIALDSAGNVYVAGTSSATTFPVTPGAPQATNAGDNDAIAFKLDVVDDDTIGVFKSSTQFQLHNTNSAGTADLAFNFGSPGDVPISGDWDGDGVDTIGAYTPSTGTFALRNSNSAGAPFVTFTFGAPNQVPISGDWDGDGVDSVGVFDPASSAFFLTNTNVVGAQADFVFSFGVAGQGALPIAGDWDGNGVDTIGIYIPSSQLFQLRNQNAGGGADLQFTFGPTNARAIAGDWDGDGVDTVGTYSVVFSFPFTTAKFSLRNSNTAGTPDVTVNFGALADKPVVGNWDGI